MSDVYLREHPPARSQYRSPRRARPTGLTVIHTAEGVLDTVGPDTGAEATAAFIRRRAEPGSYHDVVDSDTALQLVRYSDEAYQDGTGSNPFALSISFALKTSDWARLSPARRDAFLTQGAAAFCRQQTWLRSKGYSTTPLRRISRADSDRGVAGFISHGDRDPGRRSDPGADFPWTRFFELCNQEDELSAQFEADARASLQHLTDTINKLGDYIWAHELELPDGRKVPAGLVLAFSDAREQATRALITRDPKAVAQAVVDLMGDDLAREVADELGTRIGGAK